MEGFKGAGGEGRGGVVPLDERAALCFTRCEIRACIDVVCERSEFIRGE